jgi:hypothetical protein
MNDDWVPCSNPPAKNILGQASEQNSPDSVAKGAWVPANDPRLRHSRAGVRGSSLRYEGQAGMTPAIKRRVNSASIYDFGMRISDLRIWIKILSIKSYIPFSPVWCPQTTPYRLICRFEIYWKATNNQFCSLIFFQNYREGFTMLLQRQ